MTLKNLLKTGQLEVFEPERAEIATIMAAVRRAMTDAQNGDVSQETRFDAAYRAIMNCAWPRSGIALWANGYRVRKSVPGHHQVMIQSLVKSIGIDQAEMKMLDVFRVKRNAIDYQGELTDTVSLRNCIEAAERLTCTLEQWLGGNRPDLL